MKRHVMIVSVFIWFIIAWCILGMQADEVKSATQHSMAPIKALAQAENTPQPETNMQVYLPVVRYTLLTHQVLGQVVDGRSWPMSGVTVYDNLGQERTTDHHGVFMFDNLPQGDYAYTVQHDTYLFAPSVREVSIQSDLTVDRFSLTASCYEAILNGGFELDQAWEFPNTAYPAIYSTAGSHTEFRSARTGIVLESDNTPSYSPIRQEISLPDAASAVLRLWLYPLSSETAPGQLAAQGVQPDSPELADAQYINVLDQEDNILETLLWMHSDSREWGYHEFDLSAYAGLTIQVEFGSYNDGYGGVTAMYVDDVSLQVCIGSDPSPTPEPTPEPPPAPDFICKNRITNTGFEYNSAWGIPQTEYPAGYTYDLAHKGERSMRTGIVDEAHNRYSYSDAWQTVEIPEDASKAWLRMWVYPISGEQPVFSKAERPQVGQAWGVDTPSHDTQYVLILDSDPPYTIREVLLWWEPPSNIQSWYFLEFNMKKYIGQQVRIQFGTYNDGAGDVSAMYVDQVKLDVCTSTSQVQALVEGCSPALGDGSFEGGDAWITPFNFYSPDYTNQYAYVGSRSMRAGIPYMAHNRPSISAFQQPVSIPEDATLVMLSAWILPSNQGDAGHDAQYLLIMDQNGHWIETLMWEVLTDPGWSRHQFDLLKYAGDSIILQFGVYNDGTGGVAAMYVDGVNLEVCR